MSNNSNNFRKLNIIENSCNLIQIAPAIASDMSDPTYTCVLEHNLGCMISQHVEAKQLSPPTKWSQQ